MESAQRHASTLVTHVNLMTQRNERVLEFLENLHCLVIIELAVSTGGCTSRWVVAMGGQGAGCEVDG